MRQLSYFLMVGLFFTVLQISTVAAEEDCASLPTPDEVAACWETKNAAPGAPGGPDGHHPPGEHHDGPPPGEDCANKPTPEETAACWDQQGGHMDHPGDHPPGEHHDGPPPGGHHDGPPPGDHPDCPAGTTCGGPDGHHPPGEHHDGPPIDPRSGQPFTKADEAKYEVYAEECESSGGVISEASAQALVADGFTRIQVDDLCKEGAHHDGPHDGPPGGPGMAPPAP